MYHLIKLWCGLCDHSGAGVYPSGKATVQAMGSSWGRVYLWEVEEAPLS